MALFIHVGMFQSLSSLMSRPGSSVRGFHIEIAQIKKKKKKKKLHLGLTGIPWDENFELSN